MAIQFWTSQDSEAALPLVMGILNVTPDSFSDGGRYVSFDAAVARAGDMLRDGADMIDVGPESTRPGAAYVDADEQIRRAVPVIEHIRANHPQAAISIDTRLASVAEAAIDAGATIVNDVSALRDDARMAKLVASRDVGVVLMHMRGSPATMQNEPQYDDVVGEVFEFLLERSRAAESAGIPAEHVLLDPGIGFGKTTAHNVALMRNLERFTNSGYPVVLGASRKRFLGATAGGGANPSMGASDRLGGSLACVARAVEAGVRVVRVHDVFESRQLIDTLCALRSS